VGKNGRLTRSSLGFSEDISCSENEMPSTNRSCSTWFLESSPPFCPEPIRPIVLRRNQGQPVQQSNLFLPTHVISLCSPQWHGALSCGSSGIVEKQFNPECSIQWYTYIETRMCGRTLGRSSGIIRDGLARHWYSVDNHLFSHYRSFTLPEPPD